ncbi:hypothetical protein BB560_003046 [Smittium megazygosporum]|uniref:Uncharacterized protein n=1 Tax=Smittium megazygosporum TaxID=133381 RepID=A0A2T9ZD23_9FUNG|nr:hypothetical protein BB560_003046 [Smittium megazygosporum]
MIFDIRKTLALATFFLSLVVGQECTDGESKCIDEFEISVYKDGNLSIPNKCGSFDNCISKDGIISCESSPFCHQTLDNANCTNSVLANSISEQALKMIKLNEKAGSTDKDTDGVSILATGDSTSASNSTHPSTNSTTNESSENITSTVIETPGTSLTHSGTYKLLHATEIQWKIFALLIGVYIITI